MPSAWASRAATAPMPHRPPSRRPMPWRWDPREPPGLSGAGDAEGEGDGDCADAEPFVSMLFPATSTPPARTTAPTAPATRRDLQCNERIQLPPCRIQMLVSGMNPILRLELHRPAI